MPAPAGASGARTNQPLSRAEQHEGEQREDRVHPPHADAIGNDAALDPDATDRQQVRVDQVNEQRHADASIAPLARRRSRLSGTASSASTNSESGNDNRQCSSARSCGSAERKSAASLLPADGLDELVFRLRCASACRARRTRRRETRSRPARLRNGARRTTRTTARPSRGRRAAAALGEDDDHAVAVLRCRNTSRSSSPTTSRA